MTTDAVPLTISEKIVGNMILLVILGLIGLGIWQGLAWLDRLRFDWDTAERKFCLARGGTIDEPRYGGITCVGLKTAEHK